MRLVIGGVSLLAGCASEAGPSVDAAEVSLLRESFLRLAWTDSAPHNPNDGFGAYVSPAGDVNGDGFADVIVGGLGFATVYHGTPDGLKRQPAWMREYKVKATNGEYVSPAGDVNGDGFDDVVVGAWMQGDVLLYLGSETGLGDTAAWESHGSKQRSYGFLAASAGDVNGDGYDDVTFVSVLNQSFTKSVSTIYVFHGSATGLSDLGDWKAVREDVGDGGGEDQVFSTQSSAAGDVNGDGYGDLLLSAHRHGSDPEDVARTYVFHGSASGLPDEPDWESASDVAAYASSAGDVNGDGFDDVLVLGPYYDNTFTNAGRIDLHLGSADGLEAAPSWTREGKADFTQLYDATPVGDANGDGYADVAVKLDHTTDEIVLFLGSDTGLSSDPIESFAPLAPHAIAGAGDVNADGYGDIVIGNLYFPWFEEPVEESYAMLFFGGPL